jgi:tRNA 2-thiocytidine biosynthesis protein TtcA
VSYRTPLEARVAKKVAKAIIEHNLIEDGDRVMIGLSGGKDSWAMLQVLDVLRQRAPIDFSLVGVNVNSGYEGFRHDLITEACQARGWECHIEHTTIGAVMDDLLDDNDTPCSLCARLRRGVLYRLASTHGATKIALGHHLDDFIETALLNLFFQGALKAMPAKLVSDNGQHIVIRPLVYVLESEARAYAQESNLPVIGCCCSACGDLSLKRQRMKRLISELELEHPDIKNSMIKALGNVVPSHLIDTKVAALTTGIREERRAARTTPGVAPLRVFRPTVTAEP